MRELRIREPWANLAYSSDGQKLEDLLSRVQMLEVRIRELEIQISANVTEKEHEREVASV